MAIVAVKHIQNVIDKSLVVGYIKRFEKTVLNAHLTIPKDIYGLIFLYFYQTERFVSKFLSHNNGLTVSNENVSFERLPKWHTIYGSKWIKSTFKIIVKWEFEILTKLSDNYSGDSQLLFGIVTRNEGAFLEPKSFRYRMYMFGNDGRYRINVETLNMEPMHFAFNKGDKVSMILDLKQRKLIQRVNDGKEFVVWNKIRVNEKVRYKMAMSFCVEKSTAVRLIAYEQHLS
eukprot:156771_1